MSLACLAGLVKTLNTTILGIKPRPHVADAKRSATSFTSAGGGADPNPTAARGGASQADPQGHVAPTGGAKMTGTQVRATRFGWTFLFGVSKISKKGTAKEAAAIADKCHWLVLRG